MCIVFFRRKTFLFQGSGQKMKLKSIIIHFLNINEPVTFLICLEFLFCNLQAFKFSIHNHKQGLTKHRFEQFPSFFQEILRFNCKGVARNTVLPFFAEDSCFLQQDFSLLHQFFYF